MQASVKKKQDRLECLERHVERLERRIDYLNARRRRLLFQLFFFVFIGGILATALLCRLFALSGLVCFLVAVVLFIYGWRTERALTRSIDRHRGLLRIKEAHIARMRLDWEELPPVEDEREKDHPFENDLLISGPHSLHRLMNVCASDQGRKRLRQWLLNRVPNLETLRSRQASVRELVPLVNFRDRLQLHSRRVILDIKQQRDGETLREWLDLPQVNRPPLFVLIVSCLLSALFGIVFLLYAYGYMQVTAVLVTFAVSFLWSLPTSKYRSRLFLDISLMLDIFKQLHTVFNFLESYPCGEHARLKQLCEPFQSSNPRPSKLLKRLKWIARGSQVTATEGRRPEQSLMMPTGGQVWSLFVNAIIPLDLSMAYLLTRCKDQARENLPRWLDAWYELEALCSLANFAYLNPDFVMPEIKSAAGEERSAAFCARQFGHPLIADEKRIVNDVTIERVGDLMLITGSNMAGKSTFLRTLGINLCLAFAGSVVNAASLETGLYEVHCCINVTDSLTDGYSYFYAEVRRLSFILDRLRQNPPYPVFVLIDEIFRGTNNRERSIGSHAYMYALTETACLGAIATHDLELVKLADELAQVKNYHFRDEVIDGEMVFDYKLHQGPCPTTNALKLMQMAGLPISWKHAPTSR